MSSPIAKSIEGLAQDLRYALRLFRKSPTFTVTAVLSLAVGIGMNTAMFSLLDAILLRNLPVRAPEELVLAAERDGARQSFSLSYPVFRGLANSAALTGLAAFRPWGVRTSSHGESEVVNGQLVSGDYFPVLGVSAAAGRLLTPEDDRDANPVAVVSYGYWRHALDGDPGAVGRTIDVQGHPFTIVGITAPHFSGLDPGKSVEITVPLSLRTIVMPGMPMMQSPTARWLRVIGRRRPGVALPQAQEQMAALWNQVQASIPRRGASNAHLELLPGGQGLYDLRREFALPLRVLMGAVALVLLVACANLASLLLARSAARRQEIALRISLGAARGRLMRQLLTESILLAGAGGVCGVALAFWAAPLLVNLMSRGRGSIVLELSLDSRTLLFTAAISLVTGVLFGIAPALRATASANMGVARVIQGRAGRWTGSLIVAQVSLCLVVLTCAGLLMGSLRNLRAVDAGFRADHVLLMGIQPGLSGYDASRTARLYGDLYQRLTAIPGVRSVSLSMDTPLGGVSYMVDASLPGATGPGDAMHVDINAIGPRFFETMGSPLLKGRELSMRDDANAPAVAVISETVAHGLFRGRDPLGQKIVVEGSPMEVVGVAKDTHYQSLRDPAQPMVYRPYLQMKGAIGLLFSIRTVGDPLAAANSVRQAVREVAPTVPVSSMSTLEDRVQATLTQERMVSTLSTWFGSFALLLAAIGLYGRLAYAVAARTREIGIRMALGAPRGAVMWAIFRQVLVLMLCGIAIGMPLAISASRTIRSLLFGMAPFDPVTLGVVATVTLGASILAACLPAMRAARVDPMVALRYE